MPVSSAMSHLYGYIYCMLLSNALVDLPFFGGALYLFGSAVMLCVTLFSRKNRKYLPLHGKRLFVFETVIIFILTVALIGLYPTSIESSRLWALYAAVALCLLGDAVSQRVTRLAASQGKKPRRLFIVGGIVLLAMIGAGCIILVNTTDGGIGWPLSGGFAVLVLFRAYAIWKDSEPEKAAESSQSREKSDSAPSMTAEHASTQEPVLKSAVSVRSVSAYQSFEWINIMLFALVELIISTIYALLATRSEWMLPSMLIGVAFTLASVEAAMIFLRRTRNVKRKDPTWLLLIGLIFCIGGSVLCGWMLTKGQVDYLRVYLCLTIVSIGGALSMSGLFRIHQLMPDVMRLVGENALTEYRKTRDTDVELARLFGDTLALIALTVICFVNKDSLPRDMGQLAARFQPMMILPVLLVAAGAFLSVFRFPLSARYISRLYAFLQLREQGEDYPVMREKLENVVSGAYRQPFLTRFLASLLRPFFRYRLANEDHIVVDERNPILFLGNHLEVLGPILATLWFPVPVRFWAINQMMDDQKKVTEYVYVNTFSKVTWLPVFLRKLVARFIGWLSVRVLSQMECIPVYRDSPMKLRETVRKSVAALESGDNLMIFPEDSDQKYELEGIGKLSPGFVMLASAYWRKTGRRLRMMPVYASKEKKTIFFGTIFEFNPDVAFAEEQNRIIRETEQQIFAMAGINPDKEDET